MTTSIPLRVFIFTSALKNTSEKGENWWRELRDIYFSMIAEKPRKIKVFQGWASKKVIRFRVFYSQHTLADFEKKCPILREKALVRKKMIFSPLRLFPTVRNTRELSERTNRTAIKHNNRKSPLNQWFSELRQLKGSFDFESGPFSRLGTSPWP